MAETTTIKKADRVVPPSWTRVESKSRPGEVYYMCKKTGEKTWKYSEMMSKEAGHGKRKREDKPSKKSSSKRPKGDDSETVHVLHLLVKHAESRRASSWRQETITRSKDVALQRLTGLRDQIVLAGINKDHEAVRAKFEELAKTESDCSSAKRGGDLGPFGRGKMQPPFEAAAFALSVHELSEPVETDSGVHIIFRLK
ncbi:peptidyl-prolyl cis-trans isomerase NIMA-interacting 1-like [Achlya hypogyna]|uniref:Peptidyl-prolyl cis-trans isomerase n=1 Tax=Achlya hypogyna TaxID=1202772 RepID=A0A1V9ZA67_ACHHY|nr:peptidyl-prolyl cis-trans isomerase NIMA-interacting 1-like [Achlya hypogyna]